MLLKGFILLLLLYWSQNGFKLFTHFLLILLSVVQHFSRPCLVFKCALEIKPNLNTAIYQETSCFLLLTRFMEILISFSSRTLAPAHSAKTTSKWFSEHEFTVLDWPANMPDLNPIWNLWDIFKNKMRNSRSKNRDELKAQ